LRLPDIEVDILG